MSVEAIIQRVLASARAGARDEAAADLAGFLKADPSGRRAAELFGALQKLIGSGKHAEAAPVLDTMWRIGHRNHSIAILLCTLVEKAKGAETANGMFRDFVAKKPVFDYQKATERDSIRVGNLLSISHETLRFSKDGFEIPTGLTESFHLLKSPRIRASLVFFEGIEDRIPEGFDVVFNSISDADTFAAELERLDEMTAGGGGRVINLPKLNSTGRDEMSEQLSGACDALIPRTVRVSSAPGAAALSRQIADAGLGYPVLLRPIGSQTGMGLVRLETSEEADAEAGDGAFYVTEFHDFRSVDGYYRKYRVWHVGGRVVPNHQFLSENWNVHGTSRKETMIKHKWMLLEEHSFLEKPVDHRISELSSVIRENTGLDYFGIDYGYMPDGTPVFFEANATMRSHYPDWYEDFPYVKTADQRHISAFQDMLAQLSARE